MIKDQLTQALFLINSLAYSWIIGLVLIWLIFSARKSKNSSFYFLLAFCLGGILSKVSGLLNSKLDFLTKVIFSQKEGFWYFLLVGLNEELIKFTASLGALFISAKILKILFLRTRIAFVNSCILAFTLLTCIFSLFVENLDLFVALVSLLIVFLNFLSSPLDRTSLEQITKKYLLKKEIIFIGICSSVGFATSENFTYALNGQGSIARFVPFCVHIYFSLFWSLGVWEAQLTQNKNKKVIYIFRGFLEGATLHAIYNTIGYLLTSKTISPELSFSFVLVYVLSGATYLSLRLNSYFKRREIDHLRFIEKTFSKNVLDLQKKDKQNSKTPLDILVLSIFVPGLGHFFKKKFVFGLLFFSLAILSTIIFIFLLGSSEYSSNSGTKIMDFLREIQKAEKSDLGTIFSSFLPVLSLAFLLVIPFCLSGFLSSLEVFLSEKQNRDSLKENFSQSRKFSKSLISSCLILICITLSLFLPNKDSSSEESSSKEIKEPKKNQEIIEIPIESEIKIEEVSKETPKQENTIDLKLDKKKNFNLTKLKEPLEEIKPEEKAEKSEKLKKIILNNKERKEFYIGIQIDQVIFKGDFRPYVVKVYPNTSAAKVGFQIRDIIISVNGSSSANIAPKDIISKIRGEFNSQVEIEVYRPSLGHNITLRPKRTGVPFNESVR